uniref:Uncharacterized protein LOC111126396 n=1 Tax=Crassostrea virginica TaxID=6565 RepID=A0A8B8DIA2_CRAVI|nr:uncharacterized protein LOC111126396 [Crassostrea virginica]
MEGLSHFSYHCGFNSYFNGSTCIPCQIGFYGKNCSDECSSGTYGLLCSKLCECPSDQCHHAYGCFPAIKDTSTLLVTKGDVLTSGSYSPEVPVSIAVNNTRGSIAFHNTETSVLLSSNDLLCIGPIKSRQTLILSIVGMNALLLLLMGIHSFLYFYEKRHSYRKRLAFKIKCEQQDDQCPANDTPVETVCFVGNPKNRQPSYEPV